MRMKGESSKSLGIWNDSIAWFQSLLKSSFLGNIGNYEIGARWHWNLQLGTVTVILLAISLVLTSILCAGFIYFWIQFAELARTKANLMEIQQEVLKVQSALNLEIEEIRKLKEDMLLNHISDAVVDREKRSAFLGKGGKVDNSKSRTKLSRDMKRAPAKSTSLSHHKSQPSFHGIFGSSLGSVFDCHMGVLSFHIPLNFLCFPKHYINPALSEACLLSYWKLILSIHDFHSTFNQIVKRPLLPINSIGCPSGEVKRELFGDGIEWDHHSVVSAVFLGVSWKYRTTRRPELQPGHSKHRALPRIRPGT